MHVRLYLVPLLGSRRLKSLTTANVRRMVSEVTGKASAATAKESHRVLRTTLTAACREELISRNVVQLVPAPRVEPRELRPWTPDETLTFVEAARTDPLYTAFVLAVALGVPGHGQEPADADDPHSADVCGATQVAAPAAGRPPRGCRGSVA